MYSTRKLSIVNQPFSESGWCEAMKGTTKEKIGQGEEEGESNHLKAKWRWAPIQTTPWRGSTCSHSSSSTRAEPNILKNSWRLRSDQDDQDGGSGGHLLGQGWVQVREKATGDLLVFVFVKKNPLKLSLFCESKSCFLTTFCVVLS